MYIKMNWEITKAEVPLVSSSKFFFFLICNHMKSLGDKGKESLGTSMRP